MTTTSQLYHPTPCEWLEEHMDRVGVEDTANRKELYRERDRGDCQFNRVCSHVRPECVSARPRAVIYNHGRDPNTPRHGGMVMSYSFHTGRNL